MKRLLAAIALVAASRAGAAEIVSARPDAVAVTLYHIDRDDTAHLMGGYGRAKFGFVTETRELDLPAGESVVRFQGVASTMVPQSANLEGLPEKPSQTDFDYDLLSPGSLIARAVGGKVTRVRLDPLTGREIREDAVLRSGPSGVVLEVNGGIEALHCGGPAERLVFDRIPEDLAATPTFSAKAFAPRAGHYTVKLTYMAEEMNWSADYVAEINADGKTLDLSGWITVMNMSDTSFVDAPTDVVAGNLDLAGDDSRPYGAPPSVDPACWPLQVEWGTDYHLLEILRRRLAGGYPQNGVYASSPVTAVNYIDPGALGDYKLYALPRPTTIGAHQAKQVQFVDRRGVRFERVYGYSFEMDDAADQTAPGVVEYILQNDRDSGLGLPLPAGNLSVHEEREGGVPVFTGENAIDNTPVGGTVYVDTNAAVDVWVQRRRLTSRTSGTGDARRTNDTYVASIENDKPVPIMFDFYQRRLHAGRIASTDRPYVMDGDSAKWRVTLAAGERVTFHYAVEYLPKLLE